MAAKFVDRVVPPPADRVVLDFPPFHLDLRGSRLMRGRSVVPLRPKTWSVLLYLAERPGALVTKDELLDAVWADVAVMPETLNKSIGELRLALGDDSHAPRFIETVHRRGFRFIAAPDATAEARTLQLPSLSGQPPRPGRRPFVGREEELQVLATRLARARAGERQIVFVTGPAGVGKTALVDAFLDSEAVSESAARVWVGRAGCFEHHGPGEAYLPVLEALEQLARPPRVERLVKLMQRAAPMWLAQMPWLIGAGDAEALRHSLQGVRAERMPRELAGLIEALTGDLTVVLVLEDLHWSDPSTVDLITLLAQRREPARLLVIGTYRPAEVAVREHVLASAVRALRIQQHCTELALQDLSEAAVRTYLARRFPGSGFPPTLAARIHAHTGGHPLFVAGIVDHLLSQGWILDTAPGWGLSTLPEMLELGVPDDVRLMIETQLQGLSPAEHGLLEPASVAGHEIAARVLAEALGCEIALAERHCETLARRQQFLRASGRIEWPDGSVSRRYAFTHELHRQVVYEEIPEERRARLHQRVGEALETAHGTRATEIAPQLALHFQQGRDPARALRYLLAAGARARQRFANREAVRYLEAALAVVELLPDQNERPRCELQVRLALGRALGDIGFAAPAVRENYERVSALAAASGSTAERFEALYARWYVHALRADREDTIGLAAELEALARQTGSAAHRVATDSVLVRTAFYDGRFAEARRHMHTLLERLPERDNAAEPIGYGVDPVIAASMHYAGALWFLGNPEAARTAARTGLEWARQSGNLFYMSAAGAQAALAELLGRNAAEGGALAEQAAALSAEQGFAFWNAMASALSGFARVLRGQTAEGVDQLARALGGLQATGTQFFTGYMCAFLAEGRLRAGAFADGLAAADAGLTTTETTLDRGYAPELWRLKGELLLAALPAPRRRSQQGTRTGRAAATAADSRWQEAERCLVRAVEMSRAAAARSLELRATASLARAWRARGRLDEARGALGEICDWFGPALVTPDLAEARALLGELAAAPASSVGRTRAL